MFPLLLLELQGRATDPRCQELAYKESPNPGIYITPLPNLRRISFGFFDIVAKHK
jgi:hypothetical protein